MERKGVNKMKKGMIAAGLTVSLVSGMGLHSAFAGPNSDSIRFESKSGRVLIVRGDRCFSQEDVTKLRLVEYEGPDFVVYRCVTP